MRLKKFYKPRIVKKFSNGTYMEITEDGFVLWDGTVKRWVIDASNFTKDGYFSIGHVEPVQEFRGSGFNFKGTYTKEEAA